jgi:hypothetical protein
VSKPFAWTAESKRLKPLKVISCGGCTLLKQGVNETETSPKSFAHGQNGGGSWRASNVSLHSTDGARSLKKFVSLPYGECKVADQLGGKLLSISNLRRI